MSENQMVRTTRRVSLIAAIFCGSVSSNALTILSGPSFANATNAPLAGLLKVRTDDDSRVSVSVDDGTESWERNFYDYGASHSIPLLGFKAGRTNTITVTVHDRYRNAVTAPQPLTFVTGPLPGN